MDKIYINPGDIVMVKHELENRPKMLVTEKVARTMMTKSGERENVFQGLRCEWYDKNQVLRDAIFSTKDLIIVK